MELSLKKIPKTLKPRLEILHSLCKQHKVKRLWVFGSVINDNLKPDSDIDFLYELDRVQISDDEFLHNFWSFYDSLKVLFKREIDLIKYGAIKNPYFLEEINETKILVYDQESTNLFV